MLATLRKENPNKNIWVLWFDQDSTPSDLAMKKSMEEDYKTQWQTYDADVHDKLPLRMKFLYPCCLHCGLEYRSQLATCKGCYLAHYCKAPGTCQKSDYARHKFFCRSVRGWILGQPYARIRPLFKYPGDTRPLRERSSMSAWSYRAYLEFLCFWEMKCIACFEGLTKGSPPRETADIWRANRYFDAYWNVGRHYFQNPSLSEVYSKDWVFLSSIERIFLSIYPSHSVWSFDDLYLQIKVPANHTSEVAFVEWMIEW